MDPEALEQEAAAELASASTADEVEELRIRYLGRKAELPQALRAVRDRETGMTLNALRDAARDRDHGAQGRPRGGRARPAGCARTSSTSRLPGRRAAARAPAPDHPDPPRGGGHLPRPRLPGGRRPRGGDDDRTTSTRSTSRRPSGPLAARDALPRRRDGAADGDVAEPDPGDGGAGSRPSTSSRSVASTGATRPTRRTRRRSTRSRVSVVDEGITLADLEGTLDYLLKALFGEERRTEFRTHYFPFTEPSIEAYVSCHVCGGDGCPVCRHSGWIEIGGAGVVDPTLFEFVGYDPERYSGFAFGWGLERIAVLRHGIPDLRELWRNDPRLLEQF
jgi:hypothetical protein